MKYKIGQTLKLKPSYLITQWGSTHSYFPIQLQRRFLIASFGFGRFRLEETLINFYKQNIQYSEKDLDKYFELENSLKTILPLP